MLRLAAVALSFAVLGTHPAPRPLAQKCGTDTFGVTAHPFWLTAADGVHLYALEQGNGRDGMVLLHESPGDLCGWLPYIPKLSRAGFRGFGDSDRPQSTR